MYLNEDLECVVCFQQYTRTHRIPRVLHCKHTFCAPCLEEMSKLQGVMCTVSCPLCRWITCARASLTLPTSLWVNTEIWDKLTENRDVETDSSEEDWINTRTLITESRLPVQKKSGFKSALQRLLSCVVLRERRSAGCSM